MTLVILLRGSVYFSYLTDENSFIVVSTKLIILSIINLLGDMMKLSIESLCQYKYDSLTVSP